jgi:glycosyltransferase involved in cell wall biosynthesis
VEKVLVFMGDFSLGGGIALPLVKYLPKFGCRPYIITNKTPLHNGDGHYSSLAGHVDVRRTICLNKSPFRIFSKLFNSWETAAWLDKLFFVPDIYVTWLPSAILAGASLMKRENIDTVLTVSPPESVHLIGLALSRMTGCRWIADFEDLWTTKKVVYQPPTTLHDRLIKKMEMSIYQNADHLLANTRGNKEVYQDYYRISPEKISVVRGGYDPEDLENIDPLKTTDDGIFNIGYMGKFDKNGFPWRESLAALKALANSHGPNIRLNICGHVAEETRRYIKNNGLEELVVCHGIFSHAEAVKRTAKNDLLLLLLYENRYSRSIVPHKLYYYLGMDRRIVAIAQEDGEVADIINETNSGEVVSAKAPSRIYDVLAGSYKQWKTNHVLASTSDREKVSQYDITLNAQKLAAIIKEKPGQFALL